MINNKYFDRIKEKTLFELFQHVVLKINWVASFDNIMYIYYKMKMGKVISSAGDYRKKLLEYGYCSKKTLDNNIPVFVCWFQGIELAPSVVKACRKSLYRKINSQLYKIEEIDEKNYRDWVELPSFIVDKYEQGKISKTHFSDIIRTTLVYLYGGIWIDSTMFLTDPLPDWIKQEEIFVFKFSQKSRQLASNQFIFAHKENEILGRTLFALTWFWKRCKKLKYYFVYHYLFALSVNCSNKTRDMFERIPVRYSQNNHFVQDKLMFKDFNEREWTYAKKISFIHKLTYKYSADIDISNTLLEFIISGKEYEQTD